MNIDGEITMNISRAFIAAIAFPFAIITGGCAENVQEAESSLNTANPLTPFKLEKIANGQFFSQEDGLYRLTIPAQSAGTPNDLKCLIGAQSINRSHAKVAMSCDYIAAHSPKP